MANDDLPFLELRFRLHVVAIASKLLYASLLALACLCTFTLSRSVARSDRDEIAGRTYDRAVHSGSLHALRTLRDRVAANEAQAATADVAEFRRLVQDLDSSMPGLAELAREEPESSLDLRIMATAAIDAFEVRERLKTDSPISPPGAGYAPL